jgi:hypothetical protein
VGVEGGKAMYPMTENTRTSVVKFLLENGASANVSGLDLNIGPLEWACQNNFVDIVQLLLEHGADVNCQNEFGDICLDSLYNKDFCFKVSSKMLDITKMLLEKGINVNLWNQEEGNPVLHSALKLIGEFKKNCDFMFEIFT